MLPQLCLRVVQLLLLVFPLLGWGATYTAYNTYLYPPFVNADGGGLAADLVALLNKRLGDDKLVLSNVPRPRFLAVANSAANDFDGIALFLVPEFVDCLLLPGRHDWSAPVFSDYNVLVFRHQQPDGVSPAALMGRRFGAVRGNTYVYVDALIQRGYVLRDDGGDELGNLRKLSAGRVDFTQLNSMYFRALSAAQPELRGLVALPEPNGAFQRRILVSRQAPEALKARLAAALAQLQHDGEWQELLQRYRLPLPGGPERARAGQGVARLAQQ